MTICRPSKKVGPEHDRLRINCSHALLVLNGGTTVSKTESLESDIGRGLAQQSCDAIALEMCHRLHENRREASDESRAKHF